MSEKMNPSSDFGPVTHALETVKTLALGEPIDAEVAFGSITTHVVTSHAMAFGRSCQVAKPGRARTFRAERIASKKTKV